MYESTLRQLLVDRSRAKPVVLATHLETGDEQLLYPFENHGDPSLLDPAQEAMRNDRSTTVNTESGPVFLHVFNPPLRMIIVGAVHISQPLSRMAILAGYDVTIIDPRSAFASEQRFPGITIRSDWPDEALTDLKLDMRTAVVALTHDPKLDDPALCIALKSPAFYIGALGSKKTHASRKERLLKTGLNLHQLERIHGGPVGLDIRARSPSEIATSVLAEIIQTLRAAL